MSDMNQGKIKIGLIGFGSWVRRAHLPALEYDGRAIITAAAAATEKTRQEIRRTLGEEVRLFGSYGELLEKSDADAVMIAVPDEVHEEALSAAIASGKAVFYEPPVSIRRSRIPIIVHSLLAAPQVTCANLELGFHPGFARAADMIRDGEIGSLQKVTITLHAGWGSAAGSDVCLINRMSCWYVDVLNRIIGAYPSRVLLLDGNGNPGRMQPVSTAIYDYNGVWGIFQAEVNRKDETSIVVDVTGDEGNICINYFTGAFGFQSVRHPGLRFSYDCPQEPYADYPGVRESVSAFLDAVESGDASQGNAATVARLNSIGLAAEESKDTGGWAGVNMLC